MLLAWLTSILQTSGSLRSRRTAAAKMSSRALVRCQIRDRSVLSLLGRGDPAVPHSGEQDRSKAWRPRLRGMQWG